jgi:hypothetical protein
LNINKTNNKCNKNKIENGFKNVCDDKQSCTINSTNIQCDGYDTVISYACIDDIGKTLIDNESMVTDEIVSHFKNRYDKMTDNASLIKNQEDQNTHNIIMQENIHDEAETPKKIFIYYDVWEKYKIWILTIGAIFILALIIIVIYANLPKTINQNDKKKYVLTK